MGISGEFRWRGKGSRGGGDSVGEWAGGGWWSLEVRVGLEGVKPGSGNFIHSNDSIGEKERR